MIYWNFFPVAVSFSGTGALHSHKATKAIQPIIVTAMPVIQGHAPLIAQLRGHSSWAKWRTVTVFFSSTFDMNGLLYSTMKLKIPCWSGIVKDVVKMVEFAVEIDGANGRRWKGESIENSSWTSSLDSGVNGISWSQKYSDNSIEYVWLSVN